MPSPSHLSPILTLWLHLPLWPNASQITATSEGIQGAPLGKLRWAPITRGIGSLPDSREVLRPNKQDNKDTAAVSN